MNSNSLIYVSGHRGMVGSAIVRGLNNNGYKNILLKTSSELDLTNQSEVNRFFQSEKPEYVFMAAAKVGGVVANSTYRAQFLYENLMIESNVIHASYIAGVQKMIFRTNK